MLKKKLTKSNSKTNTFLANHSMRILYLFLKIVMNYSLRVYFPRMKFINMPKKRLGRTIYVSNHAASFMDPISIAGLTRPIVFFMTRSDVFTSITKPILWACQMLPIYRQKDGDDAVKKNEAIFIKCGKILKYGRNLLIFGEGFTDDIFIRRLKKVKKGAVRIGFQALEAQNWKKDIYIAAVGCNYSNPNQMRSDLLISFSDKICLNDYKEVYLKNPNKVINDLTLIVEKRMQEQITHNSIKERAPLHERIMVLTRRGMNAINFNRKIKLEERWRYSQDLANWLNNPERKEDRIEKLNQKTIDYDTLLKKEKVKESLVFWKLENPSGSRSKELISLLVLFPFALIGTLQCAVPFLFSKRTVEKMMKRPVFWGSVKVVFGMITIAIFNIPSTILFHKYISLNGWMTFGYFLSIGLTGLAAYIWMTSRNTYIEKGRINQKNMQSIFEERAAVMNELHQFLPEKFH